MSWTRVPVIRRDFGYFDRQMDLHSDWKKDFDDTWRDLDRDSSRQRFDQHLKETRKKMYRIENSGTLDYGNPFVTDAYGKTKLCLRFDVSQFKPTEVKVQTIGHRVKIHADHTEDKDGRKIHREITKEFTIPENIDPLFLTSYLSRDGVLQIEAPAPKGVTGPRENLVPIDRL